MDVYEYIARSNPRASARLVEQFGYRNLKGSYLPNNLRELVQREGAPALEAILDLHPDRDVILEINEKHHNASGNDNPPPQKCHCGCGEGRYMNASGPQDTAHLAMQFNTAMFFGAMLIAVALIMK